MEKLKFNIGLGGFRLSQPRVAQEGDVATLGFNGDFAPKPNEMLAVDFRLLSATMIGAETWKATFFPAEVLKEAAMKFSQNPVCVEHEFGVFGWDKVDILIKGIVGDTEFQDAKVAENGAAIPAGVNGTLIIDAKTNTALARAISFGGINSCSVSVEFEFKKSHDIEDFSGRVGQYTEKGEMIHRIATKIIRVNEVSLVALGADPFAKKLDNEGNVPKSALEKYKATRMFASEADEKSEFEKFGFVSVVCDDTLNFSISNQKSYANTTVDFAKQLSAKENEILQLKAENEQLKEKAQIGEKLFLSLQGEAKRLFSIVNPNSQTQLDLSTIEKCETVINEYKEAANEKFGGQSCVKCGGKMSFQKSKTFQEKNDVFDKFLKDT